MKAVMYLRPGIGLREVDEPQIQNPDDVKIKIDYASICGSDTHMIQGEWDDEYLEPLIIGHEAAGVITEIGPEAKIKGLKVGDKVAVYHSEYCGKCFFCRNGQEHLCTNKRVFAACMAEYVVAAEQVVHKLPDGVDTLRGCMSEPISTCLHGVDLLDVRPGTSVAIYGAGGLGLLMIQLLRMAGATDITVIEPIEAKRQKALALKADHVLDPRDEDFIAKARAITNGRGFERIMEISGSTMAAEAALKTISRGGKIVYFANYIPNYHLPVDMFRFVNDEITISGIYQSPYVFPRVMSILPKLDLRDQTEAIYPIENIEEAWEAHMSKRYPKIVLKVSKD